ncbi:MAG: NUDIX domain-containing protein [Calditrichia bacterium]
MPKKSAGILMYRIKDSQVRVLLLHMGGPFWAKKDAGAWSIPKGEYGEDEEPQQAARREFREETGSEINGPFIPLAPLQQKGGKWVHAFAAEGDFNPGSLKSNTFPLEWPPKSGRMQEFPEADRAAWFDLPQAREKILKSQIPLLDELEEIIKRGETEKG